MAEDVKSMDRLAILDLIYVYLCAGSVAGYVFPPVRFFERYGEERPRQVRRDYV